MRKLITGQMHSLVFVVFATTRSYCNFKYLYICLSVRGIWQQHDNVKA